MDTRRSRMRMAILIVCGTILAPQATRAQGTCTGGALSGEVGLSILDGNGGRKTIPPAEVPYVFGAAECACNSNDIALDIALTAALPAGSVGVAELWAGTNCDTDIAARTTIGSRLCEKLGAVDFSQFVVGTAPEQHIQIPFSALPLFSPTVHQCPTVGALNSLYVLLFHGSFSSPTGIPYATCSLSLREQVQGPAAPTALTASPEDGAVTLSWSGPDATQQLPMFYQVLCSDTLGAPLAPSPRPEAAYSVCRDGRLERRHLSAPASLPPGEIESLAHAFVCSEMIPSGAGTMSQRISGLRAGATYELVVVGIDIFGNATPSALVQATIPPTSNGGGCSAAGGTLPTPLLALVVVLGLALLRRHSPTRD